MTKAKDKAIADAKKAKKVTLGTSFKSFMIILP